MSFDLVLRADIRDWGEVQRAVEATASSGHLPVSAFPRRRFLRSRKPGVQFDYRAAQAVLAESAHLREAAFTLSEEGRAALAATIRSLASVLGPSWSVRACWHGDELRHVQSVSAEELAELVERSLLARDTLYCVGPIA